MNIGPVYSSGRSTGPACASSNWLPVDGLEVEEIETIEACDLIQPYPSAEGLAVVELDVEHIELSLAQANGRGSAGHLPATEKCPARHSAKTPAVQERVIRVAAGSGLASARATAHAAEGQGVV